LSVPYLEKCSSQLQRSEAICEQLLFLLSTSIERTVERDQLAIAKFLVVGSHAMTKFVMQSQLKNTETPIKSLLKNTNTIPYVTGLHNSAAQRYNDHVDYGTSASARRDIIAMIRGQPPGVSVLRRG